MLTLSLASLLTSPSLASAQDEAPPESAESILRKVVDAYAALETYADTGDAVTEIESDGVKTSHSLTFETAWRDPDRLRFVCTGADATGDGDDVFAMWSDPEVEGAIVWWETLADIGKEPMQRHADLRAPMQMATSISSGVASMVVPLLMGEYTSMATGVNDPILEDDEDIDGARCRVISGRYGDMADVTLWIGADDMLIRRIRTFTDSESMQRMRGEIGEEDYYPRQKMDVRVPEDMTSTTTINFAPTADPTVADEDLIFTPPEAKQAEAEPSEDSR